MEFFKKLDLPKRIGFIYPHPDDDILSLSLSIHNRDLSGQNAFLLLTGGDKGNKYLNSPIGDEELVRRRVGEYNNALDHIGVHPNHRMICGLPDGELISGNYDHKIEEHIIDFIEKTMPEILVSFDECGYTRHNDHIKTHEIVKKVAKRLNLPFIAVCPPPEENVPGFHDFLREKRKTFHVYSDEKIDLKSHDFLLRIPTSIILDYIAKYETQGGVNPYRFMPEKHIEDFLSNQYFRFVKD